MPLYWLVYRLNNQISVVIEPTHSLVYARLRASLDGLDEGEFTDDPSCAPQSGTISNFGSQSEMGLRSVRKYPR
jgi:hypothetical protein